MFQMILIEQKKTKESHRTILYAVSIHLFFFTEYESLKN